jgi:hypothetical protein
MFLPVPTRACYRCADDGVRSLADNVPNRVRMVTREPLEESSFVKGKGQGDMVKIIEHLQASSRATDLRGLTKAVSGRRPLPRVSGKGSGCRSLTYLHGTVESPA